MNQSLKKVSIRILALLGFCLTIELAYIYYTANYQPYTLSSFCSVNEFVDCDGAAKSSLSQFLGIPLAYWGMLFYITIFFLTIVNGLKKIKFLKFLEVFKNPNSYIAFLGFIAFGVSMILATKSFFDIKKLCILCLVTYFIDFFIAVISIDFKFNNILKSVKDTFVDFIDGAKQYPKTLIILLVASVAFLTYTETTYTFVSPHLKKRRDILYYRNLQSNPYNINGNILGNPNGDVVVELYSDYVCPLCYIINIMLHKAVNEFENVKVVHYNSPFDLSCNKYIHLNMHPGACFMSKIALAAKKQDNYWGMSSLLYEKQPQNEEAALLLIEQLNLDKEKFLKDLKSIEVKNELINDIEKFNYLNLDSTPTMFINGIKYVGVKPYYELKEILKSNGAKRR